MPIPTRSALSCISFLAELVVRDCSPARIAANFRDRPAVALQVDQPTTLRAPCLDRSVRACLVSLVAQVAACSFSFEIDRFVGGAHLGPALFDGCWHVIWWHGPVPWSVRRIRLECGDACLRCWQTGCEFALPYQPGYARLGPRCEKVRPYGLATRVARLSRGFRSQAEMPALVHLRSEKAKFSDPWRYSELF